MDPLRLHAKDIADRCTKDRCEADLTLRKRGRTDCIVAYGCATAGQYPEED
jgi:hypothetical protein